MTDEEIFELVKRNYHEVNKEYIEEQIRIAMEQINKDDKST